MPRKTQPKRSAGSRKPRQGQARRPTARQRPGLAGRLVAATGATIARNPALVGGSTAFVVALFFVSANAMWYQPHLQSSAFFQTRALPEVKLLPAPEDEALGTGTEQPAAAASSQPVDSTVKQVQETLAGLKLYGGRVDGRMGTSTSEAIATYQKILGQPVTGRIDETLLNHLGIHHASVSTASIAPDTAPVPQVSPFSQPALETHELISRIQKGLKAFGNEDVDVDGMIGTKTRTGIREFQSLFGLAVTGEPDMELYAKMQEIGLVE